MVALMSDLQMTSYRTAMRLERERVPTPCISALQLPYSADSSTSVAARSLMAGFGRLTKINTSVRRSTTSLSTTTLTAAPNRSLTFGQSTPTLTLEEQAQRDLEEDRKDAEREMQRYEEAALLDATAERTADIVRFWEVRARFYFFNYPLNEYNIFCSKKNIYSRCFSVSQWMVFPRRLHLSLPNESSHLAKRHAQIGVPTSHQQFSKLYKYSSSLTSKTG
ncbi:uncharacterized protein HD556DRAFT_60231 [Suillus plorans]|uniref:Uncharacterized protein n=1 Tax=Suillus plorans TaxID=116603 RepID=A0A9P7DPA8_9AGAM|nr:uncharacterized protein HD556DRAFT_60231 [Suillus plorans]KAG1799724.1 hypothetical protein HD556DRAFT_60231 [Suillus plorans]